MKTVILLFCLVTGLVTTSLSQTDYEGWRTLYIESGKNREALEKGMAAHNKKYHASGPYEAYVWEIIIGKHEGQYLLAMGPCTFTDLDTKPFGKEHDEDWQKNVMNYVEKESSYKFWKVNDKVSYQPENGLSGKVIWTSYDIKPFEGYRFKAMLEKVAEVYRTKKYNHSFMVYETQFDIGDGEDIVLEWQFDKWAWLDREEKFMKDYEEVHGEGTWRYFMEEYKDVVEDSYDEVAIFRKDLGGAE